MKPRLYLLREAVHHNARLLLDQTGVSRMVAVVKDDAYGVGLDAWLRVLPDTWVAWYAVATLEEALRLERLGIPPDRILLLYPLVDEASLQEVRATPVHVALGSPEMFVLLERHPEAVDPERIHLSLDLDMVRTGFQWEEWVSLASRWPWPRPPIAWMGHFAHDPGVRPEAFEKAVVRANFYHRRLQEMWGKPIPAHLANTAVALSGTRLPQRWIRPGLGLFGIHPSRHRPDPLRLALRLEAPLLQVHHVPAGTGVSYGHRFVTSRPSRIGVLRIGYGDGLPRALSPHGWAVIRGHRAPIVGAITMDLTLVDLTDLPFEPLPGEAGVLLGDPPAMNLWTWAEAAGTIPYEVMTHFSSRIERVVEGSHPTTSQSNPPASKPAPRSSRRMPR